MKIAIISDYISSSKDLDYYQSQQINLSKELSKLGYEIDIISAKRSDGDSEYFEVDNQVRVFRMPVIAKWTERFIKQPITPGLWGKLSQRKYDYIISSEFYTISSFIAGLYTLLKKQNKLIIFQGIYCNSSKRLMRAIMATHGFLVSPFLRRVVSNVICKTSSAAEYLKKKGFANTSIIPVGVDNEVFFNENTENPKELRLLTVGEMIPRKNYPLILKTFKQLTQLNPATHLTIIGDGQEKNSIMDFIKTNDLADCVSVIEKIPNTELRKYYNSSHFFLLFSKVEIFGMVLLEAMACGCPVISTRTAGAMDVIDDGTNGVLISKEDPDEIALRINDSYKNLNEYERLKAQALESINKKYSWNIVAQQYNRLLKEPM